MNCRVSVITPIYNTEDDLERCLQTLLAQTLSEMEFIWIDNGASDECRRIIRKYANKRQGIRVVTLTENIGYCGAMNKGLSQATGKYVGFCDSDDYVDADYYEKLYKQAEASKADVTYCGLILEYKNKSVKRELLATNITTPSLLDHLRYGSVWNGLFRRTFIKKNNISFSENKSSIYRDNTFCIPAILRANKTAIVKDAFYHYVQHTKSTISGLDETTKKEQTYQTLEEILKKVRPIDRTDSFIKFLFRSLSIMQLDTLPTEANLLKKKKMWKQLYFQARTFSHPTWAQRFFSIVHHPMKPVIKIRFLGISFKIKQKEKSL